MEERNITLGNRRCAAVPVGEVCAGVVENLEIDEAESVGPFAGIAQIQEVTNIDLGAFIGDDRGHLSCHRKSFGAAREFVDNFGGRKLRETVFALTYDFERAGAVVQSADVPLIDQCFHETVDAAFRMQRLAFWKALMNASNSACFSVSPIMPHPDETGFRSRSQRSEHHDDWRLQPSAPM